jgi:hypothetical protein
LELFWFVSETIERKSFDAVGLEFGLDTRNVEWLCRIAVRVLGTANESASGVVSSKPSPQQRRNPTVRWLELLGFILPRRTRLESYEPYLYDLIADYLLARQFRSKWARRWLKACFAIRTISTVIKCFSLLLGEAGRKLLVYLLPESWQRFLSK